MGFEVGTWSQLPNPSVASEEVLDGYGGVVPDPVATQGVVAPRWFAVCELDLEHRAATVDRVATDRRRACPDELRAILQRVVVAVDASFLIGKSHRTSGGPDALAALVERFTREKRYPRQEDLDNIAARRDLLLTLTRATLDAAIGDPRVVHVQEFRRIASNACGGPGNQIQINVYLSGGLAAVPAVARTLRHLLYGPSREVDRLDDVLEDPAWKVRGFARPSRSSPSRS